MTAPKKPTRNDVTSKEQEEAEQFERGVLDGIWQRKVADEAKRRLDAEKAEAIEIPKPERLDRLLRRKIPGEKYLIDGLWPTDGNIMFGAQRKAGKTTTVVNLVRSLVDGDPFMDHFDVVATRRVVLLDFEMTERMFQEWAQLQGIRNRRSLSVLFMRGRAGTFNILDDKVRARWARMIQDTGAEVLILDPLRPIIDSLGIKEANELGPILQAFAALKVEAGISEGMIVQHFGHGAQRVVGDSRQEGWPDAIWNITRHDPTDPHSYRYFQAFGRGVSVEKGMLLKDDWDRLEFKTDIAEESRAVTFERLVEWLEQEKAKDEEAQAAGEELKGVPGERNTSQVIEAGIQGFSRNRAAAQLDQAVRAERVLLRDEGKGKPKWYSLP